MVNLHSLAQKGLLPARIAVVVASRECKGVERAKELNLPVHIVPFGQMPDLESYSSRITAILLQARVDLVVMAGFLSMWRISTEYEGRVMNIHPALLPSFGGKGMFGHRVHEAVLAAGCKVSGCTVHFVNNNYDEGPIIVQRCVEVLKNDTPDTLADRVFEQECQAYPEAIRLFAAGRLRIDGRVVHRLD